jgi:hypothetical protein
VDVGSQQGRRAEGPPLAFSNEPIPLGDAPRGGHEQRPREVRGGLGQDAGRVADRDAAARARRDVDVVVPDGEVRDDLQAGPSRVEELVVDPLRRQREDAIDADDPAQELGPGRRHVFVPHVHVAGLPDRDESLVRDGARHEHTRAGG